MDVPTPLMRGRGVRGPPAQGQTFPTRLLVSRWSIRRITVTRTTFGVNPMPSRTFPSAVAGIALAVSLYVWGGSSNALDPVSAQNLLPTMTPIKHLVVIYNENVSFDHYFATYPYATNPSG